MPATSCPTPESQSLTKWAKWCPLCVSGGAGWGGWSHQTVNRVAPEQTSLPLTHLEAGKPQIWKFDRLSVSRFTFQFTHGCFCVALWGRGKRSGLFCVYALRQSCGVATVCGLQLLGLKRSFCFQGMCHCAWLVLAPLY